MDSKLVNAEEFNRNVENWTVSTRHAMIRRAPVGWGSARDEEKLIGTQSFVNMNRDGEASNVKFLIPRHGVFVHYGVGRGWIRQGNSIVRGSLTASAKRSKQRNRRVILLSAGGEGRKPVDWFDVEIKRGIRQLADHVQEYYGDKAMQSIIDKQRRYLIEK